MPKGEIVSWNDERGFGFIAGDDGERYFFHVTDIVNTDTRPVKGDSVTFGASIGKEGKWQAKRVSIAGADPPLPPTGPATEERHDPRGGTCGLWPCSCF